MRSDLERQQARLTTILAVDAVPTAAITLAPAAVMADVAVASADGVIIAVSGHLLIEALCIFFMLVTDVSVDTATYL